MKHIRSLIAAKIGAIRYSVVHLPYGYNPTSDPGLNQEVFDQAFVHALKAFGLLPEPLLLFEHEREAALSILTDLIWKSMAHGDECMLKGDAERLAEEIFAENAAVGSKYFSNRGVSTRSVFNSLTESTFDSGVIVSSEDGVFFCVWFEDED